MKSTTSPVLPLHTPPGSRHPTPPHDDFALSPLRSSTDSQVDAVTAVNTPFTRTPATSDNNLYDLGDGTGPTGVLEKEMGLKERTRETGEVGHVIPGVRERREKVDLGNGMEEVVVIEWLPNDREVSLCKIAYLFLD